jgi:hypothetical protein
MPEKPLETPSVHKLGTAEQAMAAVTPIDYVDPILFEMGVFANQADYERTIDEMVEKIKRGELQREPEPDEEI